MNCGSIFGHLPISNIFTNRFITRTYEIQYRQETSVDIRDETTTGDQIKTRALLVGLLGLSVSICAFASQPVELELDDEVAQRLNSISFARRITKPTIRLVMGYGKLSVLFSAATSLLLLIAVMSKASWWRHGARWLAAPALLIMALEATSDASDALIIALLNGSTEPLHLAAQVVTAVLLVTAEILIWYFIAKFFEHNNPQETEQYQEFFDQNL